MKFQFYIVNLFDGIVVGTNKANIAESYAISEDYFVIDIQNNKWILSDLEKEEIQEIKV